MFEYMENLSPAEADNIKKTIQDLFRQTCILQVKYDPVTMEQKNNPRYQICMRHRDFIADYVSVMGCELIYDAMTHIFRLGGEGAPVEHMNLFTTKLVVLLKKIYYDKIMGEGLNAPVTNLSEIREYGMDTSLLQDRIPEQDWNEALGMLKVHQIIEIPGAIMNLMDNTPIYINTTVNMYCSAVDINELVAKYSGELDIKEAGEERMTDETGKEDLHQNVSE